MNSRHKLSFVFILILLAAVLIFALSPGCQPKPQYQKIDFTRLEPPGAAAPGESSEVLLRVAFAGVVSPTETLKIYNQMVEYLGQALFRPVEIIQRSNYAEINDLVRSRYVDLAFVCSLAYVVGNNEFGMEILVVPQVGGGTVYHSYIIVPANSKSESLADLRGKAFAFTDPLSNSGRLAPTYRLHQMGATPDNFFGKYFPHSPVDFMWFIIRGKSSSYSAFVYCLFRMQYSALFILIHPNRLLQLSTNEQ